jgi:hypothetical protein
MLRGPSVSARTGAMHHRSERSLSLGVEPFDSLDLPPSNLLSATGASIRKSDDVAKLDSFAVVTLRNDTASPLKFDVQVLPTFPRFLTFRLEPGGQRAFFSLFRPGIDSPRFQVEFLAIPDRAHTHATETLTAFNVLKIPPDGRIDHEDGRLYVFRPTAHGGCGLFAP